MPNCINLKRRFGAVFRVQNEEAYKAEHGTAARKHDPWYMIIPCQHGHIYPHGKNLLGVATNKRGGIAQKLRKIPGVQVVQDGDDGINAIFHVDLLDQVAAVIKPRRRRRMTEEQKANAVARLAKIRLKSG